MRAENMPAGEVYHFEQAMRRELGEDASSVVNRTNHDPSLARRFANFMVTTSLKTVDHGRAQDIMGTHYFGVHHAVRHFQVEPTTFQKAGFSEIPFSAEELSAVSETHILMAVFPLSIIGLCGRVPQQFLYGRVGAPQPIQAPFVHEKGDSCWWLIRKDIVPESFGRPWLHQRAAIPAGEEMLPAQVIVYAMAAYRFLTGNRMFRSTAVCSASLFRNNQSAHMRHLPSGIEILEEGYSLTANTALCSGRRAD
jgi:hypothetical protein